MSSQRRDWMNFYKDPNHKKLPIKRTFKPKGIQYTAQVLARFFMRLMNTVSYLPDKEGNIVFEVSYNEILKVICRAEIPRQLRIQLKKYGFFIERKGRSTVQVVYNS